MISVPDLLKRIRSRSLTQCSWFPIIQKAKTDVENWSRVNIHTEERQTAHKRRGMLLFQLSTWKSKGIKENEIKDKGEVRKTVGKRGKKTIGNKQRGRHWTEVMREETTERRRKGWGSEIEEMSQWRMQRPNTKKKYRKKILSCRNMNRRRSRNDNKQLYSLQSNLRVNCSFITYLKLDKKQLKRTQEYQKTIKRRSIISRISDVSPTKSFLKKRHFFSNTGRLFREWSSCWTTNSRASCGNTNASWNDSNSKVFWTQVRFKYSEIRLLQGGDSWKWQPMQNCLKQHSF